MLLSDIDPRERPGKHVRVRLRPDGACEDLSTTQGSAHDPAEDGLTGTLRRCDCSPDRPAHACLVELDPVAARSVGAPRQAVTALLLEHAYAPDELEVLQDEPADPERLRLVRDNLRALGADLEAAMVAGDHDDWVAMLQAVHRIQGRTVATRGLLERMLGQDTAATEPHLVRAVRAIRRLISAREVNSLPADDLRARMRGVLQVLNRELKALLSPPDRPSIP
jgi:hypothetical protein